MTDLTQIEISKIKDLKLIHFHYAKEAKFNNRKFLDVQVVYGNDKVLAFDFKSKYFQELVLKIFQVYKKEKELGRVVLLGDLTRSIMQNETFDFEEKEEDVLLQDDPIPALGMPTNKIMRSFDYISELLESVLKIYFKHPLLEIKEIKGRNNRYIATYTVDKTLDKEVCFVARCDKFGNIMIDINNILGNVKNIECFIEYKNGEVQIHFDSKDSVLFGSLRFDGSEGKFTKEITSDGICVEYEEEVLENSVDKKGLIEFYFKLLNLGEPSKIYRTVGNSYIMNEVDENDLSSEKATIERKSSHVILKEDEVNILNSKTLEFKESEYELSSAIYEEKTNITVKRVEIDNCNYVIVQKYYPIVKNATGYYKNNKEDKYSYSILKVKKDIKLDEIFDIEEVYTLESVANNLEEVKRMIKEKVVR